MTSREFQIFVKPVGADCNLRCRYCYYLDKKNLYSPAHKFLMNDEILEKYIFQHIEASADDAIINFSWHGGEPLLAGIKFFRKVLALQKRYKPANALVINGIQTNATLLDEGWCRFLSEEQFIAGVSIDGPGDFHDSFRRTANSGNTFDKVMKGYDLLKKHGIKTEILCVVNTVNSKKPLEVYNFFRKIEAGYLTFLPLVERIGETSTVSKRSVPSLDFGIFLSIIFDKWVEKDIGTIKIQVFEEAARPAFNQEHTLCIFKKNCGGVPVIEHTGDFYSCDHYVESRYLLGNIKTQSIGYLLDDPRQNNFGLSKSAALPKYCIECEVLSMCNGECPKNRFINTPAGEPGLNYLCSGYKYFFTHCKPFIEAISIAWKNQNNSDNV